MWPPPAPPRRHAPAVGGHRFSERCERTVGGSNRPSQRRAYPLHRVLDVGRVPERQVLRQAAISRRSTRRASLPAVVSPGPAPLSCTRRWSASSARGGSSRRRSSSWLCRSGSASRVITTARLLTGRCYCRRPPAPSRAPSTLHRRKSFTSNPPECPQVVSTSGSCSTAS